MQNYRWATLGCGVIANELAQALASRGQTLYSVANRTHAKAEAFAEKYGIEKVYDQIDDVFADPDVDIIYISLRTTPTSSTCARHWPRVSTFCARNPSP